MPTKILNNLLGPFLQTGANNLALNFHLNGGINLRSPLAASWSVKLNTILITALFYTDRGKEILIPLNESFSLVVPLSLSHLPCHPKQEEKGLVCTHCPYFLVLSLLCPGPKPFNKCLSGWLNLAKRPSVSKVQGSICDSCASFSSWMPLGLLGNQLSLLSAL